jgi:hypothetical protein
MQPRATRFLLPRLVLGFVLQLPLTAAPVSARALPFGPSVARFSSQLPIFVLDNNGAGQLLKDGVDHPALLHVFPPAATPTSNFERPPPVTMTTTLTVRGSSSAEFPKKSYTLELRDAHGKKHAQPLLDLPACETWALIAPWRFDPSYINNALVYALSNRLGRWAPRTRFVEVFFNADGGNIELTDYAGIYVLTDRIDADEHRIPQIGTAKNSKDASEDGYIFKIDGANPSDVSWRTEHGVGGDGSSSVVLVSPKAGDVRPAQHAYLRDTIQQMENALHRDRATGWSQRTHLEYIDRGAWIDHHLLNTLAGNPDALVRSAHFTKAAGGRIAAGPVWDFDRALGSYWDERSYRWNIWFGVGGIDVWNTGWFGVIAHDPEFMQGWIDRWQALRRAELSNRSLSDLVTSLGQSVGAEAAARDAARWLDNASPYGSHMAQLEYSKRWLSQRAEWIDEQFGPAPSISAEGASVTFTPASGAELVFTRDGSDPRSLGGAIAPNAETSPAPLTVSIKANVHVRCYRADKMGIFPGSPWSSAVATESASPLSPRGRLVNISTRATLDAGDEPMIIGVVASDTSSKHYLARAVGPGLAAFGVSGFVPHPQLSVFVGDVELVRNRGWESSTAASELARYANAVGAFPFASGSGDSALIHEVRGANSTSQITSSRGGIALAELYELDDNGRTTSVSVRAMVRSRDGALVSGFVIRGPAYQRVLVRAIGPTLRDFGIANALSDPLLTIHSASTRVGSNQRWQAASNVTAIESATTAVGAFNLGDRAADAAMLVTLAPGAYTATIEGVSGSDGIVLLEIYDVP